MRQASHPSLATLTPNDLANTDPLFKPCMMNACNDMQTILDLANDMTCNEKKLNTHITPSSSFLFWVYHHTE